MYKPRTIDPPPSHRRRGRDRTIRRRARWVSEWFQKIANPLL
jgi:hypothetical protein